MLLLLLLQIVGSAPSAAPAMAPSPPPAQSAYGDYTPPPSATYGPARRDHGARHGRRMHRPVDCGPRHVRDARACHGHRAWYLRHPHQGYF